jgi:hypothetical protein
VNPDDPRGIDDFIPEPEDMAQGGRAGFKDGEGIMMAGSLGDEKDDISREMFDKPVKDLNPDQLQELMEELERLREKFRAAQGGRAGFKAGLSKAFLEFMKKFKVKQSGDDVEDFLSKRQFMKDIVGNTKETEKAMQLYKIKKSTEEYMKRYKGYQFPSDEQIKIDLEKRIQPILNKGRKLNATGGRIGLKAGMTKRAFLKLMGMTGAGIAGLKSGILGLGKGAGKQVAEEVVQQSTTTPPPYFFELANKIKKFGTDTTPTNDRTIAKSLKSKDGKSDYILEEDVTSGDTIIKKVNKEGDEMITDVQIMEFRTGEVVRGKDGKALRTPDEYEEVTETNSRIYKDNYNASDYTDGIEEIEIKKIIDEASEQAPSIKKAGGGIARMLGE